MTRTTIKLKKSVDKLNQKINRLPNLIDDVQISIGLHCEIVELIKRALVNYCIAELSDESFNIVILDIEISIRNMKKKDAHFNQNFNKREILRELFTTYDDNNYVIIEPEVSFFINQTHNKDLDIHIQSEIISFFKKRLDILKDINEREESLRIIRSN